jgi:16S rRNA (cytidine1402-2'-O)-methyltransferase
LSGTLYIVATPIGNLADVTERARRTLASVAAVAAEDTRHTGQLLAQFGLHVPLISVHEHNEDARATELVARLARGEDVALVSDAGTPLVSDPGFRVVTAAVAAGVRVVPIPGACALIAALSVAGLPTDRFVFEGFLPHKSAARRARLATLSTEPRTLVFYESPHRVKQTLGDMVTAFGADRPAVLARELTKLHETVYRGSLADLLGHATSDPDVSRGELVLMVRGAPEVVDSTQEEARVANALRRLLPHVPVSVAVDVVVDLLGARRNDVYDRALQIKREPDNGFS